MARNFLTAINLNKNELQNPLAHNLAAAPASPAKGQFYMNTTDNTLYYWDGSQWQSAKGGSTPFPGFGAVTAEQTFGAGKNDGVATTAARADHTHGNPTHDNAAHNGINLSALAAPTADVSMGGFKLTNVGTPLASTDAANKGYVDNAVAGLSWKDSVRMATTSNVALTGAGVAVDGVTPVVGDRILVKNQSSPQENGIYVVAAGAWARAGDADIAAEIEGMAAYVNEGTTNGDTAWVCTANAPITVGTTPLPFVQFVGGGTITAGNGLTQTGNTLNVGAGTGITVNADDVAVALNGVDNPRLADMAQNTIKGRIGAGTGDPEDLTAAQVRSILGSLRSATVNCVAGTVTTVNHNFGYRNVSVTVWRNSTPWDDVDPDIERPDGNNVVVRFNAAVAANEYQIMVVG